MKYKLSMIALSLVFLWNPSARAQESYISACASALSIDEVSGYSNEVVQLALLTMMVSSSTDEKEFKSKFAGMLGAGFFDGSLSGARATKNQLEKRLSLYFNQQSASGYLAKYLSPSGAGAFSKCVETAFAKPGLHLSIKNSDENTVSIIAIYRTTSGENRNFKIKIYSDGNMPAGINTNIPAAGAQRSFVIAKANPAKDLHVQVDITAGDDVVDSADVFIPPLVQATSVESTSVVTSELSNSECGSFGDSKEYGGNTVTIVPTEPDAIFDLSSVVGELTSLKGEKGKVPGAGSRMEFIKKETRMISAKSICAPGSSTDEHYWVSGRIKAMQVKKNVSKKEPVNNGVEAVFRQVAG